MQCEMDVVSSKAQFDVHFLHPKDQSAVLFCFAITGSLILRTDFSSAWRVK